LSYRPVALWDKKNDSGNPGAGQDLPAEEFDDLAPDLGERDEEPNMLGMTGRRAGFWLLCGLLTASAAADEFPDSMTRWVAIEANPVFRGAGGESWDAKIRERGWVVIDGEGTYHLFYTGYNDDRSPDRSLGHATSADGLAWGRDPRNPIHDSSWVEDMCVVRDGALYRMFAEGEGDIAHQLTSEDLIHWTERGPLDIRKADGQPIAPGPRGTPTVLVKDGTWYLLYERGDRGVWLAKAEDADRMRWVNVQDDPVLRMGPEPYDRTAVALNCVVKRDGVFYAFYHANDQMPWKDWTTCVARSNDLVRWEKFSGNPILRRNSSSGVLVDPDGDGPIEGRLYTMHPEVRVHVHPKAAGRGD
jgi:hypothetical protein